MKLVVLDGLAANPGDIDLAAWNALCDSEGHLIEIEIYARTSPEELMDRARDAELLMTNKTLLMADALQRLPRLRYIGVLATGYNVVDTDEARRRGIVVTNIPAYSTASVAQMVFAHLLHHTHHVAEHSRAVHDGRWQTADDFCFWDYPLVELAGQTMGVVGLGHTGLATASIAQAIGMHVMAWSSKSAGDLSALGITKAETLEQLFRTADVLSLHCPLTPETHHIVRRETLAWMKPTAILINTGRGPLVSEQDLADALREGRLHAAGVDVLTEEPPRQGSPLIGLENCTITPHVAWATLQARQRLWQVALQNLKDFLCGTPHNVV